MRSLLWVALVAAAATTGARGARHASRVDSVGALAAWQGEPREGEISQTYSLVTVEDEPAATGAACLDGTPPAYLFAPSKGGLNATSWVIWYKCVIAERAARQAHVVTSNETAPPSALPPSKPGCAARACGLTSC